MKAPKIGKVTYSGGTSTGGFLTRDKTLLFEGTGVAKAKITIFDNGVAIGTAKVDKNGKWAFDSAALADGAHSFTARAKLGKDASPASKAVLGQIDATAPKAPGKPDLAAASDTGASNSDNLTSDNTPTLTGTAEAGATITIKDGATVLGTVVAHAATGAWSFTTKALSNGAHSLTATATDKAGNVGAPSPALVVTIDRAAPAAPGKPDLAAASDSGSSNSDNLTNDTTPTLTGTAEAGSTVTIKDGATVLGTVTAHATTGAWTFTTGVLSNGAHSLTVTATDKAGNVGAPSAALVVTVDTSAPDAPTGLELAAADDTGSSSIDNVTSQTTLLTITGSGANGATVTLFDDADNDGVKDIGETILGTGVVAGAAFSIDVSLASGLHHVRGFVADDAGNVGVSTALDITVDTTAPSGASVTFNDVDGRISPAESEASAYTVAGIEAGATATVTFTSSNGGPPVVVTGVGNGAFSADLSGLVDGIVSVAISETDAAGNTGAGTGDTSILDADLDINPGAADFVSLGQGFSIAGKFQGDGAGWSVSSVGDFNGDGFDDVIVGAIDSDGPFVNQAASGEAFVVFGKAGGFANFDASDLDGTNGFHIFANYGSARFGYSVSSAGDINADGFDDLIVSSFNGSSGGVTVVFGQAAPMPGYIDLVADDLLSSGMGFYLLQSSYAGLGIAVSEAGDVNGDGIDDLIVGTQIGDAAVVFGNKTTPFTAIDISAPTFLTSGQGFRILGADGANRNSVSSAGDVNGDGFDDLIIGAPGGDGPADDRTSAGEATIVFGKATIGSANIDLSSLSSADGFRIFGADPNDEVGSVSSAGDINGDGFDDLIIGARYGDGPGNDRSSAGEAIVVFGKASGLSDIDVSSGTLVSSGRGFRIFGQLVDDNAGISVSSAGDVNGDGYDDLIVGAPGSLFGTGAGKAIVVFGKADGFADIDLSATDLAASGKGFQILGAEAGDLAGWSVSSAGDIDGDGFDDLIVGAKGSDGKTPYFPYTKPLSGEAIIVFGADFLGGVVRAGTSGSDTLTGTSAAETFVAGRGDDTMIGLGGADSFRGGAGMDTVLVGDMNFRKVDGGSGTDLLNFTPGEQTIDFTIIDNNKVVGIEQMGTVDGSADTLRIGALDMLHFSDTPHISFTGADSKTNQLVIYGDAEDTLELIGFDPGSGGAYEWTAVAGAENRNLSDTASGEFDFYNLVRDGKVLASIAVSEMDVLLT